MKKISVESLKQQLQEDEELTLVNTLEPEQFEQTRIPGSINIPQNRDDFVDRVCEKLGSKQRQVVVYCASADCQSSQLAAEKLSAAGFNVVEFEGGAETWKASGEPLHS